MYAASTTVAPSISTLSRIYTIQYNVLYVLSHPQFIKTISDNSFLTQPGSAITIHRVWGPGEGGGDDGD